MYKPNILPPSLPETHFYRLLLLLGAGGVAGDGPLAGAAALGVAAAGLGVRIVQFGVLLRGLAVSPVVRPLRVAC